MNELLARIAACTRNQCMLRPGHTHSCLPTPGRVLLCVHCSGKGNSDRHGHGWDCTKCRGTCLAG